MQEEEKIVTTCIAQNKTSSALLLEGFKAYDTIFQNFQYFIKTWSDEPYFLNADKMN